MKLGVVGLPNVGKSTLFNAITKNNIPSENYPFCTIEPNTGVVAVPDERLLKLANMYKTQKITPATIEFVDIAGLVKGASQGEGLGNNKSILIIKIQSFDDWKCISLGTKSKNKMVFLITLATCKVLTVILFLESPQNQAIRKVSSVIYRFDSIDGKRIFPYGILTSSRHHTRNNDGITERNHLGLGII